MSETQFPKGGERTGRAVHLWKPIGSHRLHAGYHWTKVSDITGAPWYVNWRATHVLRWEQEHGPVPEGMVLKSRDSNPLNSAPENWELVPRGVLPRLNGIHGHGYDDAPAEIKPTIMALAKLEHALASRRRERAS